MGGRQLNQRAGNRIQFQLPWPPERSVRRRDLVGGMVKLKIV
jgi:hypothetical protein